MLNKIFLVGKEKSNIYTLRLRYINFGIELIGFVTPFILILINQFKIDYLVIVVSIVLYSNSLLGLVSGFFLKQNKSGYFPYILKYSSNKLLVDIEAESNGFAAILMSIFIFAMTTIFVFLSIMTYYQGNILKHL